MQTIESFPFDVEETPHLAIQMPDGVSLSARVWKPINAGPVPAILEFLPYRKRDGTAERDALTHPYMAGHGYVCVRVDMRGCGDSEGLFDDEYSPQELADGAAVVGWLAEQEWCDGNVGMMGISWGGFNGLQIAAMAPEPLKAVVSICSTVDRYADDIHYKGGVMLGENPAWAATVLGWFALPPDPEIVGDGWRDMWLERLENTPFLAESWVEHQTRDAYWKHGSVCENYDAIKAAVLSVGGWHDGYRNTIAHLVSNLSSPVKGLIGPWNHKYAHFAVPGPQIDFLGEMLNWWDHWLKGIDNGVDDLPDMRRWLMDSVAPEVRYDFRPGRWIVDDGVDVSAPSEVWHFTSSGLREKARDMMRVVTPNLSCGQFSGEYFPFGFGPGELPGDQRGDDAVSTCFDTPELQEPRDIVGAPELRVRLSSDQSRGQIAVRLCDVRPDGSSALITHGFLNLRQRDGADTFVDFPIGEDRDVSIILDHCAYRLPRGHKLRVALSTSYWPFVWPETTMATLQVTSGALSLPVRSGRAEDEWHFDVAKGARPRETRRRSETLEKKRWIRDIGANTLTLKIEGDTGLIEDLETGLVSGSNLKERFSICESDPLSAQAKFVWDRDLSRGDWSAHVKADLEMRCDEENFIIFADLSVSEGDTEIFAKSWKAKVPRL